MKIAHPRLVLALENALPVLVMALLLLYTYAYFFVLPYTGMYWEVGGRVSSLYRQTNADSPLHLGDRLIRIGAVSMAQFEENLFQQMPLDVPPGDRVPLIVERQGEQLALEWVMPGPTSAEVRTRLLYIWWLPYLFWGTGTFALLAVRPRAAQRTALVAFNYLTATWISAGSGLSHSHIWLSPFIFRTAGWLCVPVYLQLNYLFPKPLGALPRWVPLSLYSAIGAIILAEWAQWLPLYSLAYGFLISALGSLALLAAHWRRHPEQRRDVALVLIGLAVGLMLPSALALLSTLFGSVDVVSGIALMALPAIPLGYINAASRQALSGIGTRSNRVLAYYTYFLLIGVSSSLLGLTLDRLIDFPGDTAVISLSIAILVGAGTLTFFARFQRWFDMRVLGIPHPLANLLEVFTERITTSLDQASLVRVLQNEVLPTLLVRQSALLLMREGQPPAALFAQGVTTDQLPAAGDVLALAATHPQFRPHSESIDAAADWIRAVFPLRLGNTLLGLWLLGRRDPDDFYASQEMPVLSALASQLAVALHNILQADRLRQMYQAHVDMRETERSHLARGLHDEVLNQLAVLSMNLDDREPSPRFRASYAAIVGHLREMIHQLRPAMLTYGLRAALAEMVDEFTSRPGQTPEVVLEIPISEARYGEQVERHAFRILQQAVENALQHAHARRIVVRGRLEDSWLEVLVEDDGLGFGGQDAQDLSTLVSNRHFGLAGMYERAALVGAQVSIQSDPGRGTRVRLTWFPSRGQAALEPGPPLPPSPGGELR
jgi:signal transduction histidine kinase